MDFIRRCQRRQWLQGFTRALLRAAWTAASVLLAAVLIGLLGPGASLPGLLLFAGALLLVGAFYRAGSLPAPGIAALGADQAFDGKALMTTAVEIRRRAEIRATDESLSSTDGSETRGDSAAAAVTLLRAKRAAADWSPDVPEKFALVGPTRYLGPAALALTAISLALLFDGDVASGNRHRDPPSAGQTPQTPSAPVTELRSALEDRDTRRPGKADDRRSTSSDLAPLTSAETKQALDEGAELETREGPDGADELSKPDGLAPADPMGDDPAASNASAGGSVARQAETVTEEPGRAETSAPQYTDIMRQGRPVASTDTGTAVEFEQGPVAVPGEDDIRAPAAATPPRSTTGVVMGPAERAYVARYMEEREKQQ